MKESAAWIELKRLEHFLPRNRKDRRYIAKLMKITGATDEDIKKQMEWYEKEIEREKEKMQANTLASQEINLTWEKKDENQEEVKNQNQENSQCDT